MTSYLNLAFVTEVANFVNSVESPGLFAHPSGRRPRHKGKAGPKGQLERSAGKVSWVRYI